MIPLTVSEDVEAAADMAALVVGSESDMVDVRDGADRLWAGRILILLARSSRFGGHGEDRAFNLPPYSTSGE